MTGFTLGRSTGATLGQSTGGTLGTVAQAYAVGGELWPTLVDEVATYRRLALTFRMETSVLTGRARTTKTDENRIDVLPTDSGGFTAIDRAGGTNTFEVTVPERRQPLRQSGTYHVARYEEELVSADLGEWDLTVGFVRDAHRQDTPSISETRGSDEWGLNTRYGTVATDRVDAEFLGTGRDGVERFALTTRVDMAQARALEAALARLDGTRIRRLPDASNVPVDATGDSGNTLTVTPPDSDTVVTQGDYVVLAWESTRLNDRFQSMEIEMAKTR